MRRFPFFQLFVLLCSFALTTAAQVPDAVSVDTSSILKQIKAPEFADFTISVSPDQKESAEKLINKKIAACSEAGGGKVELKAGEYFCNGPIILKSGVNLHLGEGVRLVFSQNPDDYLPMVLARWEGTEVYNYSPFIYACDVENIAITGKGIIDGNGSAENGFREWRGKQKADQNKLREMGRNELPVDQRIFGEGHFLRPQLIHFINCNNILLEDFKVVNCAFWLIQPTYCNNVTIRGLHIDSRFINNDGVDLDSDTNVLIENCYFNTGDDFVAIKSGRDQDGWRVNKPSRNIIIRNCISENCLHGISFGSEISGGVENVCVENIYFKKIRKYGLQFKSNKDRGGYIRNIVINGISIDTVQTCISFTNQYHSYNGGNSPTLFENIRIGNLECKVATGKAFSMIGLPEKPIRNISLKNIQIKDAGEQSVFEQVENTNWDNVKF